MKIRHQHLLLFLLTASAVSITRTAELPNEHHDINRMRARTNQNTARSQSTKMMMQEKEEERSERQLVSCPPGQGADGATNTCSFCDKGYYNPIATTGACLPCNPGYFSSSIASSSCSLCSSNSYSSAAAAQCASTCPAGMGGGGGGNPSACLPCGMNTYNTGSSATCTFCSAGTYSSVNGSVSSNTCLPCPSGYICPFGTPTPLDCQAGTVPNPTNDQCVACSSGYYSPIAGASSCLQCPTQNISTSQGATSCAQCSAGYIPNANRNGCDACGVGFFGGAPGDTVCSPCPSGSIAAWTGQSVCSTCVAGRIPSATRDQCVACSAGYFSPIAGASSCLQCPPQNISTSQGAISCDQCLLGYIPNANRNGCDACSAGLYSAVPGDTTCQKCAPGTISSSLASTSCSVCASGSVPNLAQNQCQLCPKGSFAPAAGLRNCTICSAGFITNTLGSSQCTPCPMGSESDPTHTQCVPCLPGKYSATPGTMCQECPPAYHSDSLYYSVSCLSCESGTFAATKGQGTCTPCGLGYYSNGNATFCSPCSPGSYGDVLGLAHCKSCRPGEFQPNSNAIACDLCPVATYNPMFGATQRSQCLQCEAGTYAPTPNSSSCLVCNPGEYSGAGYSACIVCPSGFREIPNTPGSICVPGTCMLGSRQSLNDAKCVQCSANTYSAPQSSSCIPCANGTYSVPGSAVCSAACVAGSTYDEASLLTSSSSSSKGIVNCRQCPKGTFQSISFDPSTASSVILEKVKCQKCVSGYVAITPGSAGCAPCGWIDKNQTSTGGGSVSGGTTAVNITVLPTSSSSSLNYKYSSYDRTTCTDTCAANEFIDAVSNTDASCEICPKSFWCLNGTTKISCATCDIGNTCLPFYAGEKCLSCAPKSFRNSGACEKCPLVPVRLIIFGVVLVILIFVVIFSSSCRRRGIVSLISSRLRILNAIDDAARVSFPDPYSFFFVFPWLLGLRLDATDIECYSSTFSFSDKWILSSFFPLTILAFLTLVYFIFVIWRENGMSAPPTLLLSAFAGGVIPFMASQGVKGLICINENVDAGSGSSSTGGHLLIDPSILCGTDAAENIHGIAGGALFLSLFLLFVGAFVDCQIIRGPGSTGGSADTVDAQELWIDAFFGTLVVIVGQASKNIQVDRTGPLVGLSVILVLLCMNFVIWLLAFFEVSEYLETSEGLHIVTLSRFMSFASDFFVLLIGIILNATYMSAVTAEETKTVVGWMLVFISIPSIFVIGWGLLKAIFLCNDDSEVEEGSSKRTNRGRINGKTVAWVTFISAVGVVCCIISAPTVQSIWIKSLQCDNKESYYKNLYGIGAQPDVGITLLMAAAASGHVDAVSNLCGDINAKDVYGRSALMYASMNGHYEVVSLLTSSTSSSSSSSSSTLSPVNVNERDSFGRSALSYASGSLSVGNLDTVQVLRTKGALLSVVDTEGRSPIWYAGEAGNTQIVTELSVDVTANASEILIAATSAGLLSEVTSAILRGASPNYTGSGGWTAVNTASMRGNGPAITLLCSYGADMAATTISPASSYIVDRYVQLYTVGNWKWIVGGNSIFDQYVPVSPIILAAESSTQNAPPPSLSYALSPLFFASVHKRPTAISALCGCSNFQLQREVSRTLLPSTTTASNSANNQKWVTQFTPIFMASLRGCDACIAPLATTCGADLNSQDVNGHTPLTLAALEHQVSTMSALCTQGANPNIRIANAGDTLVIRFSEIGDTSRPAAAAATATTSASQGTLYFADILSTLLSSPCNANPNIQETGSGYTALMKAAMNFQRNTAKLLYSHGANVELTDFNTGRTALHLISLLSSADEPDLLSTMVTLCVDLHALPDNIDSSTGQTPLMKAVSRADLSMVKVLLTPCNAAASVQEVSTGHTAIMKLMLDLSPSQTKILILQAICQASSANRVSASSTKSLNGYTALIHAVAAPFTDTAFIEALVKTCQVNVEVRDTSKYRDTALTKATRFGWLDETKKLCELGASGDSHFDANSLNAVMIATVGGFSNLLDTLKYTCNSNLEVRDPNITSQETALIKGIRKRTVNDATYRLLQLGASAFRTDGVNGYSPVRIAARVKNYGILQYLCDSSYGYQACGSFTCTQSSGNYYLTKYVCDWCKDSSHSSCSGCKATESTLIGYYKTCTNPLHAEMGDAMSDTCAEDPSPGSSSSYYYNNDCDSIKSYLSSWRNQQFCHGTCYDMSSTTCFAPNSKIKVRLQRGRGGGGAGGEEGETMTTKQLSELQPGDEVQAINRQTGELIWSPFYVDTHLSVSRNFTNFLVLTTNDAVSFLSSAEKSSHHHHHHPPYTPSSSSSSITITAGHYLPVFPGGGCPLSPSSSSLSSMLSGYAERFDNDVASKNRGEWKSDGRRVTFEDFLIPAGNVKLGDGIFVLDSENQNDATTSHFRCSIVTNITTITIEGHSSPYTLEGTIVVDGIAASVYANVQGGDGGDGGSSPSSMHLLLAQAHESKRFARTLWKTLSWMRVSEDVVQAVVLFMCIHAENLQVWVLQLTMSLIVIVGANKMWKTKREAK